MSKYGLKKRLVWSVFRIEKIRDKDNDTGLKEGEGTEMSTTVLSLRFVITYLRGIM